MSRRLSGGSGKALGSYAFLLLSALVCLSTLRHVGVSAQSTGTGGGGGNNNNNGGGGNSQDWEHLYDGYEVYAVLPTGLEYRAFSDMTIFLTMPQNVSSSFNAMRGWCRGSMVLYRRPAVAVLSQGAVLR